MLAKRIIACLDIKAGRTVKGTNFVGLRDAGDPVELAVRYCEEGVDELVFLDITASTEKRKTLALLARTVAANINIPFVIGGGVNSLDDVHVLLNNGADKITVNTAAVQSPRLVDALATQFGSQCIVAAIDTALIDGAWRVVTHGGRQATEKLAIDWATELASRGAGEILLTSMEHDGTKTGFAIDITKSVSNAVPVPVIASGGGGTLEHFFDVFTRGGADAALAASVFHFKEISIPSLKQYLSANHIAIRL